MKKAWFILLALSLGLNAGVLFMHFASPESRHLVPPFLTHGNDRFQERVHDHGDHGDHPVFDRIMEHRMGRLADRLGLDGPQREHLSVTIETMIPRVLQQRENVATARESLREMYLAADMDPAAVRSAVKALNEAHATLDSLVAESILQEAEILSPEQRERFMKSMPWERHLHTGSDGADHRGRGGRGKGRRHQ